MSDVTRLPFAILAGASMTTDGDPMPSLIKIYALQRKEITSCLCPIEIQLITSTYSYGKNSYLSAGTIDFTLAIEIRSESTEVQASAFTRRK